MVIIMKTLISAWGMPIFSALLKRFKERNPLNPLPSFLCRLDLFEAHAQLERTKEELSETREELMLTQCQIRNSDAQLRDTEKRLSQLSQNR